MINFIIGAVAGGLAFWFWGDQVRRYATDGTRSIRGKAADTLRVVEDTADSALDRAKEQLHSTLQAGQDAVRPRTF